MRIFIAESLDGEDLYDNRREGLALFEILNTAGIKAEYKVVLGQQELRRSIQRAAKTDSLVFHLSSHGDGDGVWLLDGSQIGWDELAGLLQPFARPDRGVVLSCCQGGIYGLSPALARAKMKCGHVFGPEIDVPYTDACIAWAMLYHQVEQDGILDPSNLRKAIDRMNASMKGQFVYRRWHAPKGPYKRWPPPSPSR